MSTPETDKIRADKALQLMKRAHDCLDTYDYSEAIKLGKKLIGLRHTSGFEILGLAYAALDKPKKAIRILEKGVEKASDVWLLWQLLGNYYSDAQRYDEALAAYEHAAKCRHCDVKSLRLNRALVMSRQNRNEEALLLLRKNRGLRLVDFRTRILEASLLQELGKTARALRIAETAFHRLAKKNEEFLWRNTDETGFIYSRLGDILWESGQQKERAIECVQQALEFNRSESNTLTLLRNINAFYSPKSKYFRLLVQGEWFEQLEGTKGKLMSAGFMASYDVVADNRKEALALLSELEPEQVRASLKINESEVLEKCPEYPKGVYRMTGRNFYPSKKKTKK